MTDQKYDNLPQRIKDIVDSWDDNGDLYVECKRVQEELEQEGWTCDYGLDGEIYEVKQVSNPKTILIGENWYYWDEYKKQWLPEFHKFEETI